MGDGLEWTEITPLMNIGVNFCKDLLPKYMEEQLGHDPSQTEIAGISIGILGCIATGTYSYLQRNSGEQAARDYLQFILLRIATDLKERKGLDVEIEVKFKN